MNQKLLVIIGPTASKKTTLAHKISLKLNGSIINADAFQVYKQINAGVNKPSFNLRNEVDYYLLDILDITESYDINAFQNDVLKSINLITQKNKLPILVGGSHLYIHSVLNGYNLSSRDKRNDSIYDSFSNEKLFNLIFKKDPNVAKKIGINNRKRLLRYADLINQDIVNNLNIKPNFDTLVIMTNLPRKQLYENINNRFLDFITNNQWIQEVHDLLENNPNLIDSNGFKAIGYQEIGRHVLYGENINYELLQKKTRNLAKMQLTWCKNKFPNKIIFNFYEDNFDDLIDLIKVWYFNN